MNKHQHFHAKVDGYDIHFMYEKGSGSNPQPLELTVDEIQGIVIDHA